MHFSHDFFFVQSQVLVYALFTNNVHTHTHTHTHIHTHTRQHHIFTPFPSPCPLIPPPHTHSHTTHLPLSLSLLVNLTHPTHHTHTSTQAPPYTEASMNTYITFRSSASRVCAALCFDRFQLGRSADGELGFKRDIFACVYIL